MPKKTRRVNTPTFDREPRFTNLEFTSNEITLSVRPTLLGQGYAADR